MYKPLQWQTTTGCRRSLKERGGRPYEANRVSETETKEKEQNELVLHTQLERLATVLGIV